VAHEEIEHMIEKWELCRDERGTSVRRVDLGVNEDMALATLHGPDRLKNGRKVAALPDMLAALKEIAETPKHGEPCPKAPEFKQSWDDNSGRYAVDKLHEIIDAARAALAKAEDRANG
jgi:hypothetical protein